MPSPLSEQIASDIAALGVRPGDVLLVHSSLKSLGRAECTPRDVIEALLSAVGEEGTLLMPALSYATVGPRPRQTTSFDVLRTKSCIGAVPEFFRTMAGVARSVHPTHSVCGIGARAAEMLADHHLDTTPCGEHSPFRRLPLAGGKLLMLGCGLRPNTSMHGVEELAPIQPFIGEPVDYRIILPDGTEIAVRIRRHAFGEHRQRYDRVGPLMPPGTMAKGKVLAADAHLLDAAAMWKGALDAMNRDPYHFVEKAEKAT